jgi:hypothetical protein
MKRVLIFPENRQYGHHWKYNIPAELLKGRELFPPVFNASFRERSAATQDLVLGVLDLALRTAEIPRFWSLFTSSPINLGLPISDSV